MNKCTAFICCLLLTGLMIVSGCAAPPARRPVSRPPAHPPAPEITAPPESTPPPVQAPAPSGPRPQGRVVEPAQPPTPRMVASLQLTEQARASLRAGKADEAIRTLERAMNLHPSNGENFYYLSEAWIMKGNLRQAQEFNRLAALHLKNDSGWMARVAQQAEKIRRAAGK